MKHECVHVWAHLQNAEKQDTKSVIYGEIHEGVTLSISRLLQLKYKSFGSFNIRSVTRISFSHSSFGHRRLN